MSTSNNEKVSIERRGLGSSIGNTPDVHPNTSVTQTVTLSRNGTNGTIYTIRDIFDGLVAQNNMVNSAGPSSIGTDYNMYIRNIRVYGVTGGFISVGWWPHRQNFATRDTALANSPEGFFFNYAQSGTNGNKLPLTALIDQPGQLTQAYDWGVEGSSRPHLSWSYPHNETLNNPFLISVGSSNQSSIACMVQSRGFGTDSNDNHIIQFDITVQPNRFILINDAFGAALNFDHLDEEYKPHIDREKRIKEGEEADEIRLKKRKIKHMKHLTLPVLDSN